MRRSFRTGLWLGVLAGLLFAIVKVVQSRRESSRAEPAEWPPFQTSTAEPVLSAVRPEAEVQDAPERARAPARARKAAKAVKAPAERVADTADGAPRKAVKKAAKKAADGAPRKAVKKVAKAAKKAVKKAAEKAWVEPEEGVCPPSHPVKAKLSSGLFHLPGMAFYNRTRADRCYADEDSAVRDGLTRSKR